MADVIGFILSAKNDASKVIKAVNKDLTELNKATAGPGGASGAQKAMTAFAASAVGVGAAAYGIKMAADAVSELGQAGASFERLSGSFNSLAASYGTNGDAILQAVDAVTQGTLSQATIMQQANNAMLLGVADTADEFSTLAKIAQTRGRAMGISMEFAFESIVKGVGRLSPLILDNLGIVINADQTYAKFAQTLGVTTDQLTEAQKRQALLNALKAEVANWDGSSVLDNAAAWERWGVAVDNAKVRLGEWLNTNTAVVAGVNELATALNIFSSGLGQSAADDFENARLQIANYRAEIERLVKSNAEIKNQGGLLNDLREVTGTIGRQEAQITSLQGKIADLQRSMGDYNFTMLETGRATVVMGAASMNAAQQMAWMDAQLGVVSDQVERYAKAAGVSEDAAKGWAQGIIESAGSAGAAIPIINQLVSEMEAAAARIQQVNNLISGAISSMVGAASEAYRNTGYNPEVIAMADEAAMGLEAMRTQLESAGVSGNALTIAMTEFEDAANAPFDAINQMASEIDKASGKSGGGGAKQLTAEFQNLQSIVSGLLSGAFEDIGGVSVDDFLPRQDSINEPARRIASVMVEGFDSEWVDYFKNSFPILWKEYMGRSGGDVKNAAGLLLRDFQNGLRPELIDKGRMKEIAKQMFYMDQSTKALIDEVAKEMAAELGITVEEATGYAGGASGGGGGGILKKIISPEEVKKIQGMLSFKPTWDFGSGGTTGSNSIVEAGKAAGVLDSDGKFKVKITLEADATTFSTVTAKTIDMTAKITTIDFNKNGLQEYIAKTFGPIGLTATLLLGSTTESGGNTEIDKLKTLLGTADLTASVSPSFNMVEWETYKTSAVGVLNGIIFNPTIKAEGEAFDKSVSDIKYKIGVGITDQAYIDSVIAWFFTNMSTAITAQITSFQVLGLVVGSYMYQGFSQYNLGLILASELSKQITEAKATFEASAKNAGKQWGDAFLKTVGANVPFELLMILTDLVTPEVIQRVKDGESRGKSE